LAILIFLSLSLLLPGQGLYSIAPNDGEASESLPVSYTVGIAVGYDGNPGGLLGEKATGRVMFGGVSSELSRKDPRQAVRWLEGLEDVSTQREWTHNEPEESSQWLQQLDAMRSLESLEARFGRG
jgi:hypothetical protein